jgi:GrpB-like predicted nucleotidyltransferase (UPF0157 family)
MDVDEPVVVVDYDPDWEVEAKEEIARLERALADWHVQIEHIGSTAVPGCAAKPVVDLQVGVRSNEEQVVAEAIAQAGYESMGEAEPGRVYLRSRQGRNFNVHVIDVEGPHWRDNLALRDYLRSDAVARADYSNAKKHAASTEPMLLAYSRAKGPALAQLVKLIESH